jgi:hypothetical protein
MKAPQDRKLPGDQRRGFDASGQPRGERLSEYFDFERWPEKKVKPVTRLELLAILTREHQVKRDSAFWYRLWRFLNRPVGSKPITLAVTKGEVERGEVTE